MNTNQNVPDRILQRLKSVKAVVLDGDGVFFTGRVFVNAKGEAFKERSFVDGQGISLLRAAGLRVAIISSEQTGFIEAVGEKLNGLPSVKSGEWPPMGIFTGPAGSQKIDTIDGWLKENDFTWDDVVYMGDDLTDFKIMQKVAFRTAPSQAEDVIKNIADWVVPRRGGDGAIRDLANAILEAKDIDATILPVR